MDHISKAARNYKPKKVSAISDRDFGKRRWRNIDPRLAEMGIAAFTHMKICCPQCAGQCDGCDWCSETGLCCPRCNGAGWLARHKKGFASETVRCDVCYRDGESFDAVVVMFAIRQYIEDWFAGTIEDPVLTRRMEEEAERKERERTWTTTGRTWKHG